MEAKLPKLLFVLHTFHLIHLAQDRRKFSMLCPPRYLYFFMDLESKNIPSFVPHTFHFIYLAQDIRNVSIFCPPRYLYTFFKDLKFENIPSFVLHTFHFIHLAQDRRKFSMFCPPQYLYFFQGFKIWKYHKFCAPHYSFDIPSSGLKKIFYVLSSTIIKLFSRIWNVKISQVLSSTLFIWYT